MLSLVRENMPADKNSPLAAFLPGFTALSLLLQKQMKSPREEELTQTLIQSYSSYKQAGRPSSEIASFLARDYMLLAQHQHNSQLPPQQAPAQHLQHNSQLPPQQTQAQHLQHNLQLPPQQASVQQLQQLQEPPGSYAAGCCTATQQAGLPVASTAQHVANMASTTQMHQQIPLALQTFTRSVDTAQQLPGQPSA